MFATELGKHLQLRQDTGFAWLPTMEPVGLKNGNWSADMTIKVDVAEAGISQQMDIIADLTPDFDSE